jgi:hypothetical protein
VLAAKVAHKGVAVFLRFQLSGVRLLSALASWSACWLRHTLLLRYVDRLLAGWRNALLSVTAMKPPGIYVVSYVKDRQNPITRLAFAIRTRSLQHKVYWRINEGMAARRQGQYK